MQPKVSIIIPIYNEKKEYLDISIGSILAQSYENLEIIMVDDGSEEECRVYCDFIAESDARIKVIHKVNQGVSEARNSGTMEATGDYIAYADADDVMVPYAIEHGINEIQKNDADMVIGAVQKIQEIKQLQVKPHKESYSVDVIQEDRFDELRCVYLNNAGPGFVGIEGSGCINRGPWCRILKKDIAKSNLFKKGFPIGEDVIWNMELLYECQTICIVREIWYGYVLHQASAIRKYYGNREELARRYIQELYSRNKDFCTQNMVSYGKNLAIEFYCILNYDMMSEQFRIDKKGKKELVRNYLKTNPWNMLMRRDVRKSLPRVHRVLLMLCPSGLWMSALNLYKHIKKGKA